MVKNSTTRDTVLIAHPKIKAVLSRLHALNESQAYSFRRLWYHIRFLIFCLWNWQRESWNAYNDLNCTDQLLSHSKETCEMIYLLAILNGATRVIECGTSFGVATIYMALAVNQNSHGQRKHESDIGITTIEKDGSKVARAKIIWKEAGTDVEKWIDAREGDLLEVLEQDETLPPVVDLVFLDAWTSLALPALKLLLPRLRNGSVIVADRTIKGKALYHDFLTFVRDPGNGFMSLTVPFPEGFEIIVYNRDVMVSWP